MSVEEQMISTIVQRMNDIHGEEKYSSLMIGELKEGNHFLLDGIQYVYVGLTPPIEDGKDAEIFAQGKVLKTKGQSRQGDVYRFPLNTIIIADGKVSGV